MELIKTSEIFTISLRILFLDTHELASWWRILVLKRFVIQVIQVSPLTVIFTVRGETCFKKENRVCSFVNFTKTMLFILIPTSLGSI